MLDADEIANFLNLEPLPLEGGWFRETYRSADPVAIRRESADGQPGMVPRAASTQIYYMLRAGETSSLHRVLSDEVFHHYMGDAVTQLLIDEREGVEHQINTIGTDLARGERPQRVAPAHVWQGCCLSSDVPGSDAKPTHGYALLGCTVAPGFEWEDFELISREHAKTLADAIPEQATLIDLLTPVEGRTRA